MVASMSRLRLAGLLEPGEKYVDHRSQEGFVTVVSELRYGFYKGGVGFVGRADGREGWVFLGEWDRVRLYEEEVSGEVSDEV
jgi:hypothetical protein